MILMGAQESKQVEETFERGDFIASIQEKYNLQPQKPTAVDEIVDALKGKHVLQKKDLISALDTKITPAGENTQQETVEKAEEGSTVAPEAEAKPKRERVYKKKHILTRGGTEYLYISEDKPFFSDR